MKKIISWLLKDFNSIGVVLIILIVPLYIIYFAEYLNGKSVNILIAVAAMVSTLLLYLAFRESKKSNDLKIYETEFDRLEKEIYKYEQRSRQKLFSETTDKMLMSVVPQTKEYLPYIDYMNFAAIKVILQQIETNERYLYVIQLLGDRDSSVLPTNERIIMESNQISILLKEINKGFRRLNWNYTNIFMTLYSIENSALIKEQKQLLISRIQPSLYDYDKISKSIDTLDEYGILLRDFKMFEITSNDQVKKSESLYTSYFPMDNDFIQSTLERYK